jgi:hypothetical protein
MAYDRQWQFEEDDWTTAIGRQQWDDDNEMAMDGQQHAECGQVLRHPPKQ